MGHDSIKKQIFKKEEMRNYRNCTTDKITLNLEIYYQSGLDILSELMEN